MENNDNAVDDSSLIVSTPAGVFKGCVLTSFCGLPLRAFRGIPYAVPPVGFFRFSRPEAYPPLSLIEYDATQEGPISLQPRGVWMGEWKRQEDCLYLNVFTPYNSTKNEKEGKPLLKKVMVFIHGGGYFMGCANQHVPGDLVAQGDVIVVTVNYRLSWLGFVKGPSKLLPTDCKGNMGLWDQLEAMKWVKRNTRSFGGDPDDVTLAGQSMGGESVSAFSVTRQAKNLFTKGIVMSGCMFGNKSTKTSSDGLLDQLIDKTGLIREGCSYSELIDELKSLPEEKFVLPLQSELMSTFTTIDGELFPASFPEMIRDKEYLTDVGFYDRDYLVTLTNNEGQLVSSGPFAITDDDEDTVSLPEMVGLTESIHHRAMDWYSQAGHHTVAPINDLMMDPVILLPSMDFINAAADHSKKGHPYFLVFDHWPSYCPDRPDTAGTVHSLDLCYLFDIEPDEIYRTYNGQRTRTGFTEEDRQLKRLYINMVVDFMHHGNADSTITPHLGEKWPPFDSNNEFYLKFGPRPAVKQFPFNERRNLWENIVPEWELEEKMSFNTTA